MDVSITPLYHEDFCTDSDVHVSKLSDKEFNWRRDYLLDTIADPPPRSGNTSINWTADMEKQFIMVVEKRGTYSLPLPEPISLNNFSNADLFAIFSKMHSRAFSRSFQLSKPVNELLNRNITNFSVRIRNYRQNDWWSTRSDDVDGPIFFDSQPYIQDRTSILPFTFAFSENFWSGQLAIDMINKMKQPFVNLHIQFLEDERLVWKPWMTNVGSVTFARETDDEDEKLIKLMKPHMVWFSNGNNPMSRRLWNSVNYVAGITHGYLGEIVQLWQSGNWHYKATKLRGWNSLYSDLTSVLKGHLFWIFGVFQLVFVSHPDNGFLIIHIKQYGGRSPRIYFKVFVGIRNLSDMVNIFAEPLDYSCYQFDPDSSLVPQSYCDLLAAYFSGFTMEHRLPIPISQ